MSKLEKATSKLAASLLLACDRCDDRGYVWRVPDGFNPFYAGGFRTADAMYKVPCACRSSRPTLEEDFRYATPGDEDFDISRARAALDALKRMAQGEQTVRSDMREKD